jgi:hypothetical protein
VVVQLGVVEQRCDAVKEVLDGQGTVTDGPTTTASPTRACTTGSGATASAGWPGWSTAPSDGGAARTGPPPGPSFG